MQSGPVEHGLGERLTLPVTLIFDLVGAKLAREAFGGFKGLFAGKPCSYIDPVGAKLAREAFGGFKALFAGKPCSYIDPVGAKLAREAFGGFKGLLAGKPRSYIDPVGAKLAREAFGSFKGLFAGKPRSCKGRAQVSSNVLLSCERAALRSVRWPICGFCIPPRRSPNCDGTTGPVDRPVRVP